MADLVKAFRQFCRRDWYIAIWLLVSLVWLPLSTLLPGVAVDLLSSNSLKVGMLGFLVAALQGGAVVAAAATISAATTTKLLGGAPGELPGRAAWSLLGSLWLLLCAAVAVPTWLFATVDVPRTWWDLPLALALLLLLTWTALLAASAADVGARRAPRALAERCRHAFGFASVRGALILALLAGVLTALSPLGLHSLAYLYAASLLSSGCAALFARLWHAVRNRTSPQTSSIARAPREDGLLGAPFAVLDFVRREERI